MAKKRTTKNANPVIVVAIIGLIGTITSAILSSPVLVAKIQNVPAPTVAIPVPTYTNTIPTPIFATAIPTPLPIQTLGLYAITGPEVSPEAGFSVDSLEDVLKFEVDLEYSSDFDLMEDVVMPYDSFHQTVIIINTNQDPIESFGGFRTNENERNLEEEAKYWDVISSKLKIVLWIQNLQKDDGLEFQIKKDVGIKIEPLYETTNPFEHINVMVSLKESGFTIPVTGGGTYYHIAPVMLESITNAMLRTSLTEYDFVNLKPGEAGPFEFLFTCGAPGFYRLILTLQVYYAGESHDVDVLPPINLVCPESITIWDYKDTSGETIQYNKWKNLGDYILQDGEYILLPAGGATATPNQ